jgi:type VI secretion system secreted protein Hcp
MGLDIFAKIAGILGESLDASHKDEIDVLSFSWGVTHPVSAPATGGGRFSRTTFHDLTTVHKIDKASLFLFHWRGRCLAKLSLAILQTPT